MGTMEDVIMKNKLAKRSSHRGGLYIYIERTDSKAEYEILNEIGERVICVEIKLDNISNIPERVFEVEKGLTEGVE